MEMQRILLTIKKTTHEKIIERAENRKISTSEYVEKAIEEKIQREQK